MAKKNQNRLYVETSLPGTGSLTLDADQSHYLANVMRAALGDTIGVFNGRDGEWTAEIAGLKKRAVGLRIVAKIKEQSTEPNLMLAFAPIKKARIDFIAQKATELGVSHLQPIYTRRTNIERVKSERLRANAIEAAEQCERLNVPTIYEPAKLVDMLAKWPPERMIMFCDEDLSGKSAHTVLSALSEDQKNRPWAIIIGPEGGFDDSERAAINSMPNTVVVSLGPRILRADTAAMAAISLWQSAIGDW